MKKRTCYIIIVIFAIIGLLVGGGVGFYFCSLTPISKNSIPVEFNIEGGTNKKQIVENLKKAGLIRNNLSVYVYLGFNKSNIKAGNYILDKNMSVQSIINKLVAGDVVKEKNTYSLTFIEGKKLKNYAEVIASATDSTQEEVLEILSDKEYLQELIDKYWFLEEDILDDKIYYPLEGYLFANTYELYNGSDAKAIIEKMLDGTNIILTEQKTAILESEYSIHELLTLASIVELEGANSSDRAKVAGVFYNRLKANWSLGSDATTYYAANVDFSERDLYKSEIYADNAYNTRAPSMAGKLPVGPICSPSKNSILAVINPEEHDFYYFVADRNKNTYFTKTEQEHNAKISELKDNNLWFTY